MSLYRFGRVNPDWHGMGQAGDHTGMGPARTRVGRPVEQDAG